MTRMSAHSDAPALVCDPDLSNPRDNAGRRGRMSSVAAPDYRASAKRHSYAKAARLGALAVDQCVDH